MTRICVLRTVVLAAGMLMSWLVSSASPACAAPGTWTPTANDMGVPRVEHAATLLHDGRVLVSGGKAGSGPVTVHATAELYDPATNLWAPAAAMSVPRQIHPSTLLLDGRVLVTGGRDAAGNSVSSAELYDPATGLWAVADSMHTPRVRHSALLLADGRVLVAGGLNDTAGARGQVVLKSAELYDPVSGLWSEAEHMSVNRYGFVAVRLADERVLVSGGASSAGDFVFPASAELYDPATDQWSAGHRMTVGRGFFAAAVLKDGRVLAVGGQVHDGSVVGDIATDACGIYSPGNDGWTVTSNMSARRSNPRAALLPDGTVLVTGGSSYVLEDHGINIDITERTVYASAERFDAAAGVFLPTGSMSVSRTGFTLTALGGGRVLAAGGSRGPGPALATAEVYE